MKKIVIIILLMFVLSFFLFSYERNLGNIYFPQFIHKDKTYNKGIYKVKVKEEEDGTYYFYLYKRGNLVLKEMAVLKPCKKPFKGVRKTVLKGKEYFRIQLYHDNKLVMGYFELKQ